MEQVNPKDYELRHQSIMLPCVRIRAKSAGGSGTVIYSETNEDDQYSTYILTNHHVVDKSISVKKEWSTLLKRERKMDYFEPVDAHFFEYKWESRNVGGSTKKCEIMAYDPNEDLALLKLKDTRQAPAVANMFPRGEEKNLRAGMPVVAVGAGLGAPPVQTGGILSQFGIDIDRKEFWLQTSPTIYGNSGGALFLRDTYELIGVPARIAVMLSGFSADAITHLSFAIPITRIYNFLEEQRFRFIYNDEFTEEGELELREEMRERAEKELAEG